MASVSGVTSSNSNSIYGNRNVLSGLATGMDTESMIQNAVSGYKTKISSLQQKQTRVTWKQEAMRSVSTPMIKFAQKYTSYSSSTNLLSSSFFSKAVTTTTNGANASKVSATGKTSSDVQLLGVKQLASKSTYSISAAALGLGGSDGTGAVSITAGEDLNLSKLMELSNVSGTLSLQYGSNRTIDLSFDDLDTYKTAEDFVKGINAKLAGATVSNSSGEVVSASTMVAATLDAASGEITFSDKQGAGNSVTIASATGKIKTTLGIDESAKSSTLNVKDKTLVDESATVGDYLSGKSLTMTVDGKTKTITLPTYDSAAANPADNFAAGLNTAVQKAFGTGVSVALTGGKLQVAGQKGSTISINATNAVGTALGLGGATATSYLNTGKTLGDLLGLSQTTDADGHITAETLAGIAGTALKSTSKITYNKTTDTYSDAEGNLTDKDGNRLGADGKQLYGYDFEINGTKLTFTRDSALENVLTAVNSNTGMSLSASFSKTTNLFQLTAQETGSAGQIVIDDTITGSTTGNLAAKLFGVINDPTSASTETAKGTFSAGRDAVLTMSVNGTKMEVSRTDNTFDVDGLSVTLKGTFGYSTEDVKDSSGTVTVPAGTFIEGTEPVTFTTSADSDKILDAVKGMVADLNEILKSVHDAYSTLPNYKSNKTRYEPLTDDDKSGMTESAIQKYEEKAKQGVLFGDNDLSSLYSKLISAIAPGGASASTLSKMGITTNYSEGITSLAVDENALRDALSSNPDSVRDAFTSTSGTGGLMVNVSKVVSDYASTTGATKGILIQKAGSSYSSLSLLNNTMQDEVDNYDKQISKWQSKLSDKVDYYTKMFTRLETLTSQMNSQSSMISGMMGG